MDTVAERLAALADHWNKVERRIKEYEHFSGTANAAAINELRYAGRRIVDVLALITSNGDSQRLSSEFSVAESYIVNADHDVTDGVCFIVMQRVAKTIEVHGVAKITKFYPDFPALYPVVLEAQSIIQGSREDRPTRRAAYAKLAAEFLPKLVNIHDALKGSPELRIPGDEEIRRLETGVSILAIITVVSGLFSALSFAITWMEWAYPDKYWNFFHALFG